jgi:hypothetical protein
LHRFTALHAMPCKAAWFGWLKTCNHATTAPGCRTSVLPVEGVGKGNARKEFGEFHFLGTVGYRFPAGGGGAGLNVFNVKVHLDLPTRGRCGASRLPRTIISRFEALPAGL